MTSKGNILIARLVAALMKCGSLPPKELETLYCVYQSGADVVGAIRALVRKCNPRCLPSACIKLVELVVWFFENEKVLENKKEISMKDLKQEFVICPNCGGEMLLVVNSVVAPSAEIKYRCSDCGATRELTNAYVSPEEMVIALFEEIDDEEEAMNFIASVESVSCGT